MVQPLKSVLWVDDEADLLESHRIYLREKGFEVDAATNADDAVEMLRRRPYGIVLLDEQMPGKRGLEAYREIRELDPLLPIVMVTKSEEDAVLREAIGVDVRDYLVKPINPRQVLTVITKVLEGPRIRAQALSRAFVERFREIELEPKLTLDWRGWIARYTELAEWDIALADAKEQSLYDSLQGLYPALRKEFANWMRGEYPRWLRELEGDRPPLSVDVVSEFLLPILERSRAAVFIVVDCLRLDQWMTLAPILAPWFDVETTHHFAVLPTATPYSRNALFSGLFPGEIAARFPDWWGEREDESLNAHEKQLLEAHLAEHKIDVPVRYDKISSANDTADLERRVSGAIAHEGVSAFVFNFVDLLTHGRSESAILQEVAKDEIALRALTKQWFERSVLFALLKEAARRRIPVLITSDHGSIHCHTPATVFAKRDATANLRYKFGEDLRAERTEHALLFGNSDDLRLPRRGLGDNTLLAVGDTFFVYPTKLREYQSRYRGSFLHGGVTPEECILPVALLYAQELMRATKFYPRLIRFLRPHGWRMAGNIIFNLIGAALDGYSFALLIPFLNALFNQPPLVVGRGWVNDFLQFTIGALLDAAHPMTSLRNVIVVLLAVVAVKNIFIWLANVLGAELQEYVTRDMRDAVYHHLVSLPIRYFTSTKVGQILSRVLSDTEQTKSLVTEVVTRAVNSASLVIVYIAYLLGISWRLTLISLIIAPLLTLVLQPLLRRLRHGYRVLRNDHGEMMSVLQESVSGIRLVKSYGAEQYEDARFTGASFKYSSGLVRMARIANIAQPLTEVLGMVIVAVLLWIGAREVLIDNSLQASQFMVFIAFVMRLLQPMKQLSQIPAVAQNSFASAERIFQVLDHPTEQALDKGTRMVDGFRRSIVFDSVSFAYDDEPVLTDIQFAAKKGDVIALVGASGAGKSTLVDLIPRFYEPTHGRILLDDVDVREITLASLRNLTGIVSQETVIFNESVRANIAYGRNDKYSDAQIEAAARAANAHAFIAELPAGYATVLGERGARLSGGQRQRIAIARALLLDPPILILDEATSALDTESERLVQEAIDRLLEGRTVFVIAHRLSTIQHATEILVLDRGRVVERGTHEELLARRGAYHRLHAMQFGDRERAVPV